MHLAVIKTEAEFGKAFYHAVQSRINIVSEKLC